MGSLVLADVIETEDTLGALFKSSSGAVATLTATAGSHTFWRSRFDIAGTGGSLSFDMDHPDTLHFAEGSAIEVAVADFRRTDVREDPPPGKDYYGVSHRRQIAEFCRAVTGDARLSVDGCIGLNTLLVIARVYQLGLARWEGIRPQEVEWAAPC
jgi:predicted dehydrogenase